VSPLERLNSLPREEALAELLRCCGAQRWASALVEARPFSSPGHLLEEAQRVWGDMGPADWREAIAHHPRIGDIARLRERFAATAAWSVQEQGGVRGASEEVLQGLAEGNRAYEERFGFTFIVCATGKSAEEMLALLRSRLANPAERELQVAAGEVARINRTRLEKLLAP
jgi:2-oxo-4-hydroxy-4-carboxy-5-ureidoimidazoline decarboxylase